MWFRSSQISLISWGNSSFFPSLRISKLLIFSVDVHLCPLFFLSWPSCSIWSSWGRDQILCTTVVTYAPALAKLMWGWNLYPGAADKLWISLHHSGNSCLYVLSLLLTSFVLLVLWGSTMVTLSWFFLVFLLKVLLQLKNTSNSQPKMNKKVCLGVSHVLGNPFGWLHLILTDL